MHLSWNCISLAFVSVDIVGRLVSTYASHPRKQTHSREQLSIAWIVVNDRKQIAEFALSLVLVAITNVSSGINLEKRYFHLHKQFANKKIGTGFVTVLAVYGNRA